MINKPFYEIRPIADFRDLLCSSAKLFPDRPAFRIRRGAEKEYSNVSYTELLHTVRALGTAMCSMGLAGKRIAVMGDNCYEWCVTYLATTCGIGVVIPIDKDLSDWDIAGLIHTGEAAAVFMDKKRADIFLERRENLPEGAILIAFDEKEREGFLNFSQVIARGEQLLSEGDTAYLDRPVDSEGMGILLFTSGTTGLAKGVMLSHKNVCSDLMALSGVVKITPEDRSLSVLPLHHTYECSLGFLMLLYSGACITFCDGLRYLTKNMQELEPTVFVTVPLMLEKIYDRILKKAGEKKAGRLAFGVGQLITSAGSAIGVNINEKIFGEITRTFGGKLRMVITGAAPMNPKVVKGFRGFGVPVYVGYGLTECSPLVIGNNDRLQLHDSVGTPLPGVEARIEDADDDGIGEICVRGPMVMLGYYKNPVETQRVLDDDGWFHTGDLGSMDEKNNFKVVGRIKNVIVTKNGKNIYPEEVEYYLGQSPFIAESVVEGFDDDESEEGTIVSAGIFPNVDAIMEKLKRKNPLSKDELKSVVADAVKEANKKLPRYKHVKRFDIREVEFVKTTTQKIKRFHKKDDAENDS